MRVSYEDIHVKLGGKEILKGISLVAKEGMITGIIGPNGCGKSTLVKTTFGICTPFAGRVMAGKYDAGKMKPGKLASMVGYVGQDADCVFDFPVEDVVSMGLYARKDRSLPGKEVVDRALSELKISHLRGRSILSLSGGEKKLVFIARAAAQGTDALILDEPTNHLDIHHQLFLMDYLKKTGKTVLIVLHDLRLAAHYCDRLCLLSDGKLAAEGTPLEVLTKERVKEIFGICGRAAVNENGQMDFALFEQ